jgi:hypothetical protein
MNRPQAFARSSITSAALVAVASAGPADEDSWPGLPRLVEIRPVVPTRVVVAAEVQAHQALDYGSGCTSAMAAAGAQL